MREPTVFHPLEPMAQMQTGYPQIEALGALSEPDVVQRVERRGSFDRDLRKRLAKKLAPPEPGGTKPPPDTPIGRGGLPPTAFPGRPVVEREAEPAPDAPEHTIVHGDSLASRARRMKRKPDERTK